MKIRQIFEASGKLFIISEDGDLYPIKANLAQGVVEFGRPIDLGNQSTSPSNDSTSPQNKTIAQRLKSWLPG